MGDGRLAEKTVKRLFHQKVVIKDVFNGAAAYVKVAHPAPAIALRRVPDVVLHAKVRSIGAHHPHAIQLRIRRLEESLVFDGIIDAVQLNRTESYLRASLKSQQRITERSFGPVGGRARGDMHRSHSEVGLVQRLSLRFAVLQVYLGSLIGI